ncbi:hypothetical protein N9174_03940 [bacterium]|nr:hypothetical protein [bacterium]
MTGVYSLQCWRYRNLDEVIKIRKVHRKGWGEPLGILCGHGSGNHSEQTMGYLRRHHIELVLVRPANLKGNGANKGAVCQMKHVLGAIDLNMSSPRSLARGVLEKPISLYIRMRNLIPVKRDILTPERGMRVKVSKGQRNLVRQHLKDHKMSKMESNEDQGKLDQLHGLIRYHSMTVDPVALKRVEKAISASEEAFITALNRKCGRKNLAYFFEFSNASSRKGMMKPIADIAISDTTSRGGTK